MKKTTVRVERTVVKIVWKRSQNAQLQKELLRLNGVWGVHQQASSGNVDSQMTCLQIAFIRYSLVYTCRVLPMVVNISTVAGS